MAVNDVWKTEVFYHAYQRQFISSMFWRETQEDMAGDPASGINEAILAQILPTFTDLLAGATIVGCLKTRKIVGAPAAEHFRPLVDENGQQPGQPAPDLVALRLNTGATVQGRPNRGALIISGISEGDIVNGVFTADLTQNRLQAFWTALQGGITGTAPSTGEWEFGYMSRAPVDAGDPLLPYPGQFVNPTVWYTTGIPVTQRSRRGTHTASRLT